MARSRKRRICTLNLPHQVTLIIKVLSSVVTANSGNFICGGEREEITSNLVQEQNQQRADALELNKKFATSIWPELEKCQINRSWTGLMPWTIDGNPMIGRFEDGIHVNTGLQSAG